MLKESTAKYIAFKASYLKKNSSEQENILKKLKPPLKNRLWGDTLDLKVAYRTLR